MEIDLIQRAGIPFTTIPAAGIHGVSWRSIPVNAWKILQGIFASRRILCQFLPDLILYTGGYIAAPLAIAALGMRIPSILFVPDIEPGKAARLIARFTNKIALPVEEAQSYYPHNYQTVVTGYPTRLDLFLWDKEKARTRIGLHEHLPVLFFSGGSKGARSINRAVQRSLTQLLDDFQIIHISGNLDWQEVRSTQTSLQHPHADRYHAFPYLHDEMGAAFACADLIISRAGASILGEYPLFGLPAILIPYPHAWRYQKVNAEYLAQKGAAVVLADNELDTNLLPKIYELTRQPGKLEAMSKAMQSLQCYPPAADRIADLARELTLHTHDNQALQNDETVTRNKDRDK